MYINSLGTEISQNHLSILNWSLNKFWGWKVWTLSFQMPCRTPFFESWMQRTIIPNKKVSYPYLGVLSKNGWMSFFTSTLLPKFQQKFTTVLDLVNRSQLSPAVFGASRNLSKSIKHQSYMKISKKRGRLVLAHNLLNVRARIGCGLFSITHLQNTHPLQVTLSFQCARLFQRVQLFSCARSFQRVQSFWCASSFQRARSFWCAHSPQRALFLVYGLLKDSHSF